MTTTQTDALMALADRYAFHIPGSQHSDEARAVLLAALQEQAPKRLWGMAGFNPPLPNVGEKYTSIHEDDLGDHVTVTGIANASSPNIAYVFLSWDDGHYGERAIDEFWQEYMLVQTNELAREGEAVAPLIKQIMEAICAGQKQRSGKSNKGTSQIPWTHTVGACAEVGNGANEHLQYRVGQTNAERSDHQCNSGCSGVSSGGAVCGQVAPQPAQPFPEADLTGVSVCCGEYAKCGRPCTPRGRWQAEQAQPVALPLTPEELDLCRQWFDSIQDTNAEYLEPSDYLLAEKLYRQLNMRVPNSISEITKSGIGGGRCISAQ